MSFKAVAVVFVVLATSGNAFASPSPSPSPDEEKQSCEHITSVCEAAGYVKDAKENNLERDCVQPILAGHAVRGVALGSDDVEACRAYRAAQKGSDSTK